MNKEEIKKDIEGLVYLYRMRDVIRYSDKREEKVRKDSVSEHIYGMMVLATYFLKFPQISENIDKEMVYKMILFHDIDEIETGDINCWDKTDRDREEARDTLSHVKKMLPKKISSEVIDLFDQAESKNSKESELVNVLDKVEPLYFLYYCDQNSVKSINNNVGTTVERVLEKMKKESLGFVIVEDHIKILSEMFLQKNG